MNEAQARRYLASLANASELETSDIIRISFDDCRVDFTPVPDTLSWRCRLSLPGADMTGTPGLDKDVLGMLLEVNAMGYAAAFTLTDTGELLLRGCILLNGLTEDALVTQIGEFIDNAEYWQQQLAMLEG